MSETLDYIIFASQFTLGYLLRLTGLYLSEAQKAQESQHSSQLDINYHQKTAVLDLDRTGSYEKVRQAVQAVCIVHSAAAWACMLYVSCVCVHAWDRHSCTRTT
jgi:hypothetical protein